MSTTKIELATNADQEEILRLYKMQLGREFCPWNEHYPAVENIEDDMSRDALFVMKEETGKIIAAISLDLDENVEALPFWSSDLQPGGELSRLAVHPDCQNQGIARQMIGYAMQILKQRGKKSVHFMVNPNNKKAVHSYAHLNFRLAGECTMYEQPFLCYEQAL